MTHFARQPDLVLSCDGPGCLAIPSKAPILYVPAKIIGRAAGFHPYDPVTLRFPHLHYCDAHWETEVTLDKLIDDRVRARIEERGRKIWPQEAKPDFEAALIQPWHVFDPSYRDYMRRIGLDTDGLGYNLTGEFYRRTREALRG